jgi:hypothetical protein
VFWWRRLWFGHWVTSSCCSHWTRHDQAQYRKRRSGTMIRNLVPARRCGVWTTSMQAQAAPVAGGRGCALTKDEEDQEACRCSMTMLCHACSTTAMASHRRVLAPPCERLVLQTVPCSHFRLPFQLLSASPTFTLTTCWRSMGRSLNQGHSSRCTTPQAHNPGADSLTSPHAA